MEIFKTHVFIAALAIGLAILAGCGKNATSSSTGPKITGVVYDISGQYAAPVYNATVTLRRAEDNGAIMATTTGGDGSFVLVDVPASTDVYINVSKATYASFNDQIINTSSDVIDKVLYIALATNVQHVVDLIAWNDPYYTGYADQSWFALDIYDTSGYEVSGVTVTAEAGDPIVLYNNGLDVFLPAGPTTALSTHSSASQIGGYNSFTGVYAFTLTDSSTSKTLKLPLVRGEMTYISVYPW